MTVKQLTKTAARLVPALEDVLGVAGFGLLVTGVGMIHLPAGLIVAGGLLMGAAYFYGSRR